MGGTKLWEHAGCDGTPSCVAVPGVAACLIGGGAGRSNLPRDRRCAD